MKTALLIVMLLASGAAFAQDRLIVIHQPDGTVLHCWQNVQTGHVWGCH